MAGTGFTKQEKVMSYLTKGKTLSQDSAYTLFNVGNLRATISDIKPMLRSQGFNVFTTIGRGGETRYGVISTKSKKKTCSR